jgi:hypothetical protein
MLDDAGRPAEAEAAYRAALPLREKLAADDPVRPAYRRALGLTQSLSKMPDS